MRPFSRPVFMLCGLLALAGCGKEQTDAPAAAPPAAPKTAVTPSSTPPSTSPAQADAALTTSELDSVGQAKDKYKIVLIVKTRNNEFFKPMIAEFEKTAGELGAAPEVQAAAQETDVEQQVALVQTEVQNGAKAILITPADSKALVPALKAA